MLLHFLGTFKALYFALSSPLVGHFYGVTFPPQFSETFSYQSSSLAKMKTSLTPRLVKLVKAKLLDGPCAILAGWCQCQPGVQTHHEIRAGTLGRCLTTGWGRPKVEPGLDIDPPTGAQPVLLRMVLGSCGTPVSSLLARTGLHCTGASQQREERGGGSGRGAGEQGEKTGVGHCTAAK